MPLRERLADFKAPRVIELETALPRGFRQDHQTQIAGAL